MVNHRPSHRALQAAIPTTRVARPSLELRRDQKTKMQQTFEFYLFSRDNHAMGRRKHIVDFLYRLQPTRNNCSTEVTFSNFQFWWILSPRSPRPPPASDYLDFTYCHFCNGEK